MPVTFTTDLPDEDQPVLGNGVEDEVAVDRESAVSDYGDVRYQIRETGQSSWDSNATGFSEFIGNYDTIQFAFVGREDGEEYEVRGRTETEHVTGAWTTTTIITQFPGATNFSVDATTKTSVDLSWTDNADNEDGFYVERQKRVGDTWSGWRVVADLAPNTTTYTDDGVQPGRDYIYRVRAYTEHTDASSSTVSTTTDSAVVRQARIPSEGWHVEVDHVDGDTVQPRLLADPQIKQQVNGLPRLRIPVPFDRRWQASGFEDADLRAYRDGRPQPVDTLVDVEHVEGDGQKQTILVAEGGSELKQRVQASYQFESAHVAAEDLISANTGYTANVDDPASETTEVLMQDIDSESEWSSILPAAPFPNDDPRYITSDGRLATQQTAYYREAEGGSGDGTLKVGDQYTSGEVMRMYANGTSRSVSVNIDYPIPASDGRLDIRLNYFDGTHPGFEVQLDGTVIGSRSADQNVMDQSSLPGIDTFVVDNELSAGSHTITLEITSQASDGSYLWFDGVLVTDNRHSSVDTYEQVSNGGLLSTPKAYPTMTTETSDAQAINQVVGGRLDTTWDDVANAQSMALSNDQGSSWEIIGSNTETVDGTFASSSAQIRARFTQSYYDSGGGTLVYDSGQSVDLYQLFADQEDTPVLVDRAFDGRLVDVLSTIAEDKNFVWEVRAQQDGSLSVEWAQAGQRTATDDPDIASYNISKNTGQLVEAATIKGGRQTQQGESITSSHGSWVALGQDDLIEGTEIVFDPSGGTQYTRSDDYEVDYLDGRLKTLSTGAMTDGSSYEVTYDYKPQGSYSAPNFDPTKEIVKHVPSIHSEQTARQLAYYLVTEFDSAVFEATVTVPRQPAGWSVIDEINPDRIPTAGEALQTRSVETTPEQIVLNLATQRGLDAYLQRVTQRLSATETKV